MRSLALAWSWLKRNWMWLLFPVGALLFLFGRFSKKTRGFNVVSPELQEYSAREDVRDEELRKNLQEVDSETAAKVADLELEHLSVVADMTESQKNRADELKGNPEALKEFLTRVGKGVRDG